MNKVKVVSPEGETTEMVESAFLGYWGPQRGWKLASETSEAPVVPPVVMTPSGSTGTGESTQTTSAPLVAGTETTP